MPSKSNTEKMYKPIVPNRIFDSLPLDDGCRYLPRSLDLTWYSMVDGPKKLSTTCYVPRVIDFTELSHEEKINSAYMSC